MIVVKIELADHAVSLFKLICEENKVDPHEVIVEMIEKYIEEHL